MDINSIGASANFLNTLTDAKVSQEKTEQEKFENLLKNAMDKKDDAELKEACAEFEAYYLNKVFNQMRKSIPKSDLYEKAQGHDMYEDMLYEEYTNEIASGRGAGLKQMLYKQLKKTYE